MMKKELDFTGAKEKALRLLELRSHSEKELTDKLIRAGADKDDIPEIMSFLKEYGFINDGEYAKSLARDLQHLKKYGRHRIKDELRMRGIRGEELENALSEIDEDDTEELLEMVRKKLGGDFEKKSVDRAVRYFLYRGYSLDDIKSAIENIRGETLFD